MCRPLPSPPGLTRGAGWRNRLARITVRNPAAAPSRALPRISCKAPSGSPPQGKAALSRSSPNGRMAGIPPSPAARGAVPSIAAIRARNSASTAARREEEDGASARDVSGGSEAAMHLPVQARFRGSRPPPLPPILPGRLAGTVTPRLGEPGRRWGTEPGGEPAVRGIGFDGGRRGPACSSVPSNVLVLF